MAALEEIRVDVYGIAERGLLVDYECRVPAGVEGIVVVREIPGFDLDGPARAVAGTFFRVEGRRRDRLPVPLAKLRAEGTVIRFERT